MSYNFDISTAPVQLGLPLAVAVLASGLYWLSRCGARASNLPPGPPTVPILGNLLIFPRGHLHFKFTEWAKQYGDTYSLKVLNKTIIVISTPTLVRELIDKRSASTCNRPKSILADMITPNNMNMGTGRFANATWRAMRKASGHLLSNENIRRLGPYQHAEAVQLMWEMVHTPDLWFEHMKRYTTSFALGIIYGKRGPTLTSPDVADFIDVHPKFLHALELGTLPPVDLFPILTIVPERWAQWKSIIKNVRHLHESLFDRLLTNVEKRLDNKQGFGVFMEQAIARAPEWGLTSREHLMHLGGVLLEGSDTTSAVLQNMVLALTKFPHVKAKAREEIDRVVGKDRMPALDDLQNLPYVLAFVEECNRYRPVGPLGLPHEMVNDEVVDGIMYPKGAVVFMNLWGMFHDERYFDRPDEFIPERFLKHPLGIKEGIEDDPARRPNMLFGAGRRVCPGLAFAKTSMDLNAANFIWGLEFLPVLDASGREMIPTMDETSTGVTATPKPFPVRVLPRSQHHKDIIEREFSASGSALASYELELSQEDKMFNATYRDAI